MTLTLSMLLKAEGGPAAKAAIDGVVQSTDKLGAATTKGVTADRAAASAKQANARASQQLATANRQAGAATGNLVANLNDIGVMLAAGQNPLQLAIQQGTQITQVIGPMGAAGAANSLKTAFLQLLNPINLVTLGVIVAAGYTVQWLTGAAEDAKDFADSVEDLTSQADKYARASDIARMSTSELRGEFGDASVELRALLKDMAELELRETQRAARKASQDLQSQIGIFDGPEFGVGNQKNLADMFDLSVWSEAARKEINAVLRAFQQLDSAGTLDEQIAAAENLKAKFTEAAMASGEISAAEDAVLAPLNEMIATLVRVRGEQAGLTDDVGRTKTEATNLVAIAGNIASTINSADGSQLVAAFQAAFPTASALLAMAQGIIDTIGGAAALQAAASGENYLGELDRTGQDSGPDSVRTRLGGGGRFAPPVRGAGLRAPRIPGGGGGGGGGAAARDEADALQELITGLEREIEELRVSDPIQKEMLQHRKALEGATEAERKKVEELIATRERERALMEGAAARAEFFGDIGNNALDALIVKGQSLNDVLQEIIGSLLKAIVQAAIFGSGPFGDLFGGGSIMSLIIPGAKAEGGMVHGPGTGTSDSIPTMLSNGEFVVNARSTAQNRHLLEAINAGGRVGHLAEGGYVGPDNRRAGARGFIERDVRISIDLSGARGDREIEQLARKGTEAALRQYDREALPASVRRVSSDPRRTG